jgi:hypothetical protein
LALEWAPTLRIQIATRGRSNLGNIMNGSKTSPLANEEARRTEFPTPTWRGPEKRRMAGGGGVFFIIGKVH